MATGSTPLFMFLNTGGTTLSGDGSYIYTGSFSGGMWIFPTVNVQDSALVSFGYFTPTAGAKTSTGYALGVLDSFNPAPGSINAMNVQSDGSVLFGAGVMTI